MASTSGDQPQELITHLITAGILSRVLIMFFQTVREITVNVLESGANLVLRGPSSAKWRLIGQQVAFKVSKKHELPMFPSASYNNKLYLK